MVRWIDAYTAHRTDLMTVKRELGTVAHCKTYGKVVHKDKRFTVVLQHTVDNCGENNDYFIIPTSLIKRGK